MIKSLPIAQVRVGADADVPRIVGRVLAGSGHALFGRPKSDLAAVASRRKKDKPADPRWFMVAVDEQNDPVAAAFYEARTPQTGRFIRSLRITSVAVDPKLDDDDHAGVSVAMIAAVVRQFASGGRGYLVADVDRASTRAAELFQAGGWKSLSPRFGWTTDRYVYFLNDAPSAA